MRILLRILIGGLLLVLAVALGAEVVALHRATLAPAVPAAPVVVRKAPGDLRPAKSVRHVPK